MGPIFEKSTRVEPFSDGIFAIATTLLVLEFRVPELHAGATSTDLAWALLGLWPSMVAYLLAFLTLLIAWLGHHILLDRASRVDGRLLVANGLFLVSVSFLPFPTAMIARNLTLPSASAAAAFYAVANVVISGTFLLLAAAARRLNPEHDAVLRVYVRNGVTGILWCCACAALALVAPFVAVVLVTGLWVSWVAPMLARAR